MKAKTIYSEDPYEEIWRILLKYSYEVHMKEFIDESEENESLRSEVSGSIMQAYSYFESSKNASLYIKPLLLYYGSSNLLNAIGILISSNSLGIKGHGMTATFSEDIGGVSVHTKNSSSGALQQYSNIFSDSLYLADGSNWNFKEIISGIFDLKDDFEATYNLTSSKTIPVEVLKQKNSDLYRVPLKEIVEKNVSFADVMGFQANYLTPEGGTDYLVLRRKINSKKDCCNYSLLGKRYFSQSYNKGGGKSPNLIMLYYMGLFMLCSACRYSPQSWHPFILKDQTGERHLVDKFLSLASRHLPQLVLETLLGERLIFSKENKQDVDLRNEFTKEEIEKIVASKIREYSLRGGK